MLSCSRVLDEGWAARPGSQIHRIRFGLEAEARPDPEYRQLIKEFSEFHLAAAWCRL